MPQTQSFGHLLRAHRRAAGLTIEQLASASGVSVRTISDMERAVSRGPQNRTVEALARALALPGSARESLRAAAARGRPRPAAPALGVCELPRVIGDFSGRELELGALQEYAARAAAGTAVVTTVTGTAGIGKTTLAIHAAGRLAPLFDDGRFFVDMRGMERTPLDSGAALSRLLRALGVPERRIASDEDERAGHLRALLRERRCLLVLDNAADEAQVRPLLPGDGPTLTLITGRRPLAGLDGVHRLPLTHPSPDDAVRLLHTIVGDALAKSDPEALRDVARLCGNLPLALRLAGNRLLSRPEWTTRQLARRLEDEERRLDALAAGDVHVGTAFSLSYEQLSPVARRTFRLLALAPATEFGPALAAVLAGLRPEEAEDALEELVELGLLASPFVDRYRFHDLVGLFAHARLTAEEPEEARTAARQRMHHWLLETATTAGRWFEPGDEQSPAGQSVPVALGTAAEAASWLQLEHLAWLAALHAAARDGEHARVVEVAESMHWFSDRWVHWGHWHEVFGLSSRAAAALGDARLEAVHLNYLAWALTDCEGRHADSLRTALRAHDLAESAGAPGQQGWALVYAASAALASQDWQNCAEYAERAAAYFRAAGDDDGYPQAMAVWGDSLLCLGRPQEALEQHRALLTVLRDPQFGGSPYVREASTALTLGRIGTARAALGQWSEAVDHFRQALPVLRRFELSSFATLYLARLGWALRRLGDAREAGRAFLEAADLHESMAETQEADALRREAAACQTEGWSPDGSRPHRPAD
ncbi:helix-turn-helix domain-containing protein [Streptomyces sp. NEAU-S77]|uniref:helix-turn-helix domain-containing protein n=1 Tax=Streptomyces sp. NEAU-S77 TaxID=3411033 RepID=UPI003B9DCF90